MEKRGPQGSLRNGEAKLLRSLPRADGVVTMSGDATPDKQEEVKPHFANVVADAFDSDVLLFNGEIMPPVDWMLTGKVSQRENKRKNLVFILVTEGGSADSAFRMMRFLQEAYEKITIVVPGWCKSAGTLMCIGGHEIIFGEVGELGPLDVQITKPDELGERTSGLAVETAFEKLRQEASNLFLNILTDISESQYRITLKTASHIAAELTVGFVAPIFEKLDPVVIAEDYRSNRVAHAYAERLNFHSKTLVRHQAFDALEKLLSGYPSHGFVIDRQEAASLFRQVKPISDEVVALIDDLGADAIMPRNRTRGQSPKLEYLNDEPEQDGPKDGQAPAGTPADSGGGSVRDGDGAAELPGSTTERDGAGEDVPASEPERKNEVQPDT